MRRTPFFDLRDWWLSDERLSELMQAQARGIVPFFPAQKPPEADSPYVIYKYKKFSSPFEWWTQKEFIFIEISAKNFEDMYEISSIMIDYANKGDLSARDLTRWLIENNRKIDFEIHSIYLDNIGDVDPSKEEGGDIKITASFCIEYSPLKGRHIKP